MFGGMSLYEASTHTFGTMATGGFSTRGASIGAFDSAYIHIVITIFMVLAGMNFNLYYKIAMKNKRFFKRHWQGLDDNNAISICMRLNEKLVVVVLDKTTGGIVTFLKPGAIDYDKAQELGWQYG